MKISNSDREQLIELFEDNRWVKYLVYGGGAIIGIWLLGKASKLISDAILNFKTLHDAIKR